MRHELGSTAPEDEAGQADSEREHAATDHALMEAIRDGCRTSLRILMQEYWGSLVAYASAFTESRDDAEDVVQETFVRVWRRRASWTASEAVNAYLYRITRNLALNVRGDATVRRGREDQGGAEPFQASSSRDPDWDFDTQSLRAEVEAAIANLPQRSRDVFVLSRFHGLTQAEIARTLDLSPQTVAMHMGAALTDLRTALSRHLHEKPSPLS